MIPYTDSIRSRSVPYVNLTIIAINVLVFFYELSLGSAREVNRFFCDWGAVPWEIADFFGQGGRPDLMGSPCLRQIHGGDMQALWTVVTSMFIHAGWAHIGGNMLFLWVFGDNVEDAMGHLGYAVFYLLVGIAASVAQVAVDVHATVPAIGASGAIAGVMAAYLVLFPGANINVLCFIFVIFVVPMRFPALVLIGLWFLLQILSGAAAIGHSLAGSDVAWFAHIGGFAAGLLLVWFFRRPGYQRRLRPLPPDDWP